MENLEDSGYNSTSSENSMLKAEDMPTVISYLEWESAEYSLQCGINWFYRHFSGLFWCGKLEYKHFTKYINWFKTATRND